MNISRLASRIKKLEIKTGVKFCSKCKTTKPVSDFYEDQRKLDGYQVYCKDCKSKQSKANYQKNPQRRKEISLKNNYGISISEFENLKIKQNNSCAICGKVAKRLNVDHDHESGKIRELLCSKHNILLGLADDSIEVLRSAIAYLEKHSEATG